MFLEGFTIVLLLALTLKPRTEKKKIYFVHIF